MDFQRRTTGHAPSAVSVVINEGTLVITLEGALTPAERELAKKPAGASKVHEFHRQLFLASSDPLREEIKRITGVAVREARGEIEGASGSVLQVFNSGAMVQVFRLERDVPPDAWSGPAIR
jgi:uncharacterized protein YbcI